MAHARGRTRDSRGVDGRPRCELNLVGLGGRLRALDSHQRLEHKRAFRREGRGEPTAEV